MFGDAARFAGSILALPAAAALDGWRRLRLPGPLVLRVDVEPEPDAESRERFLHRLRRVASDGSVDAVLFRIRGPLGGWAANQDLRDAIQRVRESGKATYAHLEQPGNAAVWVAAACDRVFVVPTGELHLVGVGAELTFFGSLLERLGVEADFEAAGAYKSFGEPFTRTFASPANLEAVDLLVADLHGQLVADLAADRELPVEAVQSALERAPIAAEDAVVAGLVDELLYEDELDRWIEETHGKKATITAFGRWAVVDAASERVAALGQAGGKVVVLHLDGPIVMEDKTGRTAIRARTVAPMIAALEEDDQVSAVVLNVNSPGGSAIASDLIWREVERLRRKKPVIASFEDVAASGGYYLAAPATEILARPATLTGSIGVFGGKLVLGDALRRVGVTTQPVLAGPNAALFSASRRFTDAQRVRFRGMLQRFYDGFVQRVAAGRKVAEEVIEPHCRGRVWTGRLARDRQLVDRLGTLEDAVARARSLAGLPASARREDRSGQPHRGLIASLIRDQLKEAVPGMARAEALLGGASALLGGPAMHVAELLVAHDGEALALLPFEARIR